LVSALVIGGASCGDDDGGGGGQRVDADPLNLEILSVSLPDGAGARPVVQFRVTDQAGAPVDLAAEIAAANASPAGVPNTIPRFTLAQLDDLGNYTSLYASTVNPRTYTAPEGQTPPPAVAKEQAAYQPAARTAAGATAPWPVADLKAVGAGVFEFTMPATTVAADRTKTHTLAMWVERRRAAADSDVAYGSHNFVPAGGAAQRDEVVTDAACNRCHGVLQAHGVRRGTQLCMTCHSPQTSDPETSRTVDFQVMVHKIHMGRDLPSVQQGENYYIVGFGGSIHDYSEVAFPWHDGVQHCTVCHSGEDGDNWRQKPSITACTSCHDNVKFAGGEATQACSALTAQTAFQDCIHSGGPLTVANADEVTTCATCHGPGAANAVDRYHHGD
jgi:OmcA/MtrC family decaheme c-type cytochrome